MTDSQMLRRQAATARRLARGVTDETLAENLSRFADECEQEAQEAERNAAQRRAFGQNARH